MPKWPNFKALPHNKSYKAKKNQFTKKTYKKRDLTENITEKASTDSDSEETEEEDFPQSD